MSQTQPFDRRAFLGAGLVSGTIGTALGLRAVLAHEGEDHGSTPAAATPGATPGATPEATPGATPEDEQTGGGGGHTHLVEMTDALVFEPASLMIRVGDTVTWHTVGAVPHTSTADPAEAVNPEESVSLPEGAEMWDSGIVNTGEEYSRTFTEPGQYTYFCIPHELAGMIGNLTVEE